MHDKIPEIRIEETDRGLVHPQERVDDLQYKGLRIIQNPKAFRFGMDAVLLSDFVHVRPGDRVVDFGTGTGILPILLSGRVNRATFSAFEIQADMADMARRSVVLNTLEDRIEVFPMDLRESPVRLGHNSQDVVVCNPPYGKQGSTLKNPNESLSAARHEGDCSLGEIVKSAQLLLKNGGRLAMVFPAFRMLELFDTMRQVKLEPKRVRLVYPDEKTPPNILLAEAVKGARSQLHWLSPLIVHDEMGRETAEIDRIYHRLPESL